MVTKSCEYMLFVNAAKIVINDAPVSRRSFKTQIFFTVISNAVQIFI